MDFLHFWIKRESDQSKCFYPFFSVFLLFFFTIESLKTHRMKSKNLRREKKKRHKKKTSRLTRMFTHRDGCAPTPETDWRTAEWTGAFPYSYSLYRMVLPLDEAHIFPDFFHTQGSLWQTEIRLGGSVGSAKSGQRRAQKKHWRNDGTRLFHRDFNKL